MTDSKSVSLPVNQSPRASCESRTRLCGLVARCSASIARDAIRRSGSPDADDLPRCKGQDFDSCDSSIDCTQATELLPAQSGAASRAKTRSKSCDSAQGRRVSFTTLGRRSRRDRIHDSGRYSHRTFCHAHDCGEKATQRAEALAQGSSSPVDVDRSGSFRTSVTYTAEVRRAAGMFRPRPSHVMSCSVSRSASDASIERKRRDSNPEGW